MSNSEALTKELFHKNTVKTNHLASISVAVLGIVFAVLAVLDHVEIYDLGGEIFRWIMFGLAVMDILVWPIAKALRYDHAIIRILILTTITISSGVIFFLYPLDAPFILYGPMVISCLYYQRKTIHATAVLSGLLFIAALLANVIFEQKEGYLQALHAL